MQDTIYREEKNRRRIKQKLSLVHAAYSKHSRLKNVACAPYDAMHVWIEHVITVTGWCKCICADDTHTRPALSIAKYVGKCIHI